MSTNGKLSERAERVLAIVAASPGLSTSRISRVAGYVDACGASYHLDRLAKAGRVHRTRVGREILWRMVGAPTEPDFVARARSTLRASDVARRALEALASAGAEGAILADVWRATGAPYPQAVWAVTALTRRGIVERLGWGRYALTAEARAHASALVARDRVGDENSPAGVA